MYINENKRNFDIKFYKLPDGTIVFDSAFMKGTAKTLEDAFHIIVNKNIDHDLYYYYDDVLDVHIGSFEPAPILKQQKGRQYLGRIRVRMELSDLQTETTIKNVSKSDDNYIKQQKYISKLKKQQKIQDIINAISKSVNNVLQFFKSTKYSIFGECIDILTNILECDMCLGRKLIKLKIPGTCNIIVDRFMTITQQDNGYYTLKDGCDIFYNMHIVEGIFQQV